MMPSLQNKSSTLAPLKCGSENTGSSSPGNNYISTPTSTIKPASAQWTISSSGNGFNGNQSRHVQNQHLTQVKSNNNSNNAMNINGQYNRPFPPNESVSRNRGIGIGHNTTTAYSPTSSNLTHTNEYRSEPVTYNNLASSVTSLTSSAYFSENENMPNPQQNLMQSSSSNQKFNREESHSLTHLPTGKQRFSSKQNGLEFRPTLMSLDPQDLARPLFCYTLQLGVTMLGTGKDCVKPPDIVLHGPKIGSQHAFVERLANEAVLHPISEETSIDGRHIKGPTTLQQGALIGIGDSYFFRYSEGPSKSTSDGRTNLNQKPFNPQHSHREQFYFDESPYAVVNNQAKGNASSSVGDVNKNLTIGETFKSSSSLPSSHPTKEFSDGQTRNRTTPSTPMPILCEDFSLSPRSSSVSAGTTTSSSSSSHPSTTSDPSDHLLAETISSDSLISSRNSKKYRDGLESEKFVNKVAIFEHLAHTQHSRPPVLPFPTVNSALYTNGKEQQCYSDVVSSNNICSSNINKRKESCHTNDTHKEFSSSSSFPKLTMSRPSVSFNRSDHGYANHLFYTNHQHHPSETVSINTSPKIVSTPESSSGSYCSSSVGTGGGGSSNSERPTYRRAGGNGNVVTFFDDYVNAGRVNNNGTPSPASMEFDEDSSLNNQYASSIPSPDSLSSISNHRLYLSSSTANNSASANGVSSGNESNGNSNLSVNVLRSSSADDGGKTSNGESLLELHRKQATSPPKEMTECLGLDEILAMCLEYEEQIAKELEGKRSASSASAAIPSVNFNAGETVSMEQIGNVKSPSGSGSNPTSPHYYSTGRIKTNGSLPRDPSRKAFNLDLLAQQHLNSPHSQISSPTNSHSHTFDDITSLTSSMTVSPSSMNSSTDGKKSSSNSPTSSTTCTSFATSTPIPYFATNEIDASNPNISFTNNTYSSSRGTTSNTSAVCQSAKSPYENLNSLTETNSFGINETVQFGNEQMQQLRVPLSPSRIRTTPDYHHYRRPILLNSSDLKNGNNGSFALSSKITCNNNASQAAVATQLSSSNSLNGADGEKANSSSLIQVTQPTGTPPHQKSKLSVSFSNSVQEYYDGKDDDDENNDDVEDQGRQTSSDSGSSSGLDKICTGHVSTTTTTTPADVSSRNQLKVNGPESSQTTRPSILRTISTEVQVHVENIKSKKGEQNANGDDDSDPNGCFNDYTSSNNNSNNNQGNKSKTPNSTMDNNNDSHGQTNLICSNNGIKPNEFMMQNTPSLKSNEILKCHQNSMNIVAVATGGVCASSLTSSSNKMGDTSDFATGKTLPLLQIQTSSTPPSSTSVNQDLTQSTSGGSTSNSGDLQSKTIGNNKNALLVPASSSSASATLSSKPSETVGSGPGNLSSSSPPSSTSLGKIHNGSSERPKYTIKIEADSWTSLKNEIMELEQQEIEALRELDIEKALLMGEEKSFESQMASDKTELLDLKDRLAQIDESNRRWRALSLERIMELKSKLMGSEKELQRLEKMHEEFCGSTDEETVLLERLKFQHELVEGDRKAFEDAEFHHMEEEVNKEAQREELTKTLADIGRKLLSRQFQLEQLRSHNRISINSSAKDIHSLEKRRQELIRQLRQLQDFLTSEGSPELGSFETFSDDNRNVDLEEKIKALYTALEAVGEDAIHIERVKSRSPIDPTLGGIMGPKTFETLREIERNREFLLNEQGAQMLEEERARVRELQKRVQDAVREEWEATRKSRNCHSLNSVGSEDSGQTISDTPTDSTGSGTDEANDMKDGGAHSNSATDGGSSPACTKGDDPSTGSGTENGSINSSGNSMNGQDSFDLSQQMRQKQSEMALAYEETRPLSGSVYESNSAVITRANNHRMQNRPLTRYLPVRWDEDQFDLRAHVESSGHQLELCPHINVSKTTARGFLSKLGSRFHNWNKRWFVFDRETRTLTYYVDKNEKKSKSRGGVHFKAIEDVYVDHLHSVKSPNPKLTFCVKTVNRVFHLLAPSPEAMRIWIDIIFTGAEGYQEFNSS